MEIHNHNLNIHCSSPKDTWDKLAEPYSKMPEWSGFNH